MPAQKLVPECSQQLNPQQPKRGNNFSAPQMDTYNVVYPYNGKSFSNKKE